MVPVWLVYLGGVTLLAGLASIVSPTGLPGLRAPDDGAAMAISGGLLTLVGLGLPAPGRRSRTNTTRLDDLVPEYQFHETHAIRIAAPPRRVFTALKAISASEIRFFGVLTWIRRLGRSGPESILNAPKHTPILELATRTGFVSLAEVPDREIVLGMIVVAPLRAHVERSAAAFEDATRPGFVKAALNFHLEAAGGGTTLTTTTRVFATDVRAARRFAVYWRLIYPGSALIRRMWLRAAQRRAETTSLHTSTR